MMLYSPIKPYKKGYLDVSDGHEIYYELCGNPNGKPVLFLHGGPGGGVSPRCRQFFNPKIYNVILFDQRGSGKSRPFASIENNTTQKLLEDIQKLLAYLGIKRVFLFGGSWGSTLALVYAIKYPKTVTGMLLRGIYFCNADDVEYFYGGGTANFFPDAWERFISLVPKKYRKHPVAFYRKKLLSKNPEISDMYAREWTRFETIMLELNMTEEKIAKDFKDNKYKAIALLEMHYETNLCFLPNDYILLNAHKLSGIPTTIVHGRYDIVCKPSNAYKLHKAIRGSRMYFVISGHSSHDKNMANKLREEMDKFADVI